MAKRWLIVLLILLLIFGGVFYWKYRAVQLSTAQAPKFPPATVASAKVTQETWRPTLPAVGSLVAEQGIAVSSEVAGIVSDILFQSGQTVQKGDLLIRLDARVDQAELDALRAAARLAQVQFNRTAELLPRKAVSQSSFDEAKAAYEATQAKVEEQQARINQKTIRAPFGGLLGIRQVSLGQYLDKGHAIVNLQRLDPIHVDYRLPERFYSRLHLGQKVQISVASLPERQFSGQITAIEPGIDSATRTTRLRATLANPEGLLRPGMFAQVITLADETETVLTIPRTAISFNTYGDFVYVLESTPDGATLATRRQVKTGAVRNGRVVIIEGLKVGEAVVRAGLVKLRDGVPVTVDNKIELNDAEVSGE